MHLLLDKKVSLNFRYRFVQLALTLYSLTLANRLPNKAEQLEYPTWGAEPLDLI